MVRLSIVVDSISLVLQTYDQIKVYKATDEAGPYTELTDAGTRIDMIPEDTIYYFEDAIGTSANWYQTSYYNSTTFAESALSTPRQGGTEEEKIGYTFNNYSPPDEEWGKIYTADDIRYTMLFGIDAVGSDIAASEFTDEQFDQIVLESLGEFESLLTMDIRKKIYKTFAANDDQSSFAWGKLWREGVDYTNEDDPYDFDPQYWKQYGFLQLRHWPLLSVERCVWLSPVLGEIMDFKQNNWLRLSKQFSQLRAYPTGGFSYGPFSVYGPLWSESYGAHYPGAFEVDYTTGYATSDHVPEGLRSAVAKYATIKALAVVGDGLLAGFSSQSVSLDGLSESFSSTQSATSAFFGARIKQYSDEINVWLEKNRYKFSPPPMSFVGT